MKKTPLDSRTPSGTFNTGGGIRATYQTFDQRPNSTVLSQAFCHSPTASHPSEYVHVCQARFWACMRPKQGRESVHTKIINSSCCFLVSSFLFVKYQQYCVLTADLDQISLTPLKLLGERKHKTNDVLWSLGSSLDSAF